MPARLLCLGDIHLGRIPSGLPETVGDTASLSPAKAWTNAVQWALDNSVDAVLLAGDVVDDMHDRFEALPLLRQEMKRLSDNGVRVLAVVGNHDVEALPRLAKLIPELTILGVDATWSETIVKGRDGTEVAIRGWSFPRSSHGKHHENPLANFPKSETNDIPSVGLLHADLDATNSPYAPVKRSELESIPMAAWLLGHIHLPGHLDEMKRPVGYLGSICGLDSGEKGWHGAWLAEVHPGGAIDMSKISISPIRWEQVSINAAEIAPGSREDVVDSILSLTHDAFSTLSNSLQEELGEERVVVCEIQIDGRSNAQRSDIQSAVDEIAANGGTTQALEDRTFIASKFSNRAKPALDLDALARGADAVAILATKIKALEENSPEARPILEEAREKISARIHTSLRRHLADNALANDAELARILVEAGYEALEAVIATGAPGAGGTPE